MNFQKIFDPIKETVKEGVTDLKKPLQQALAVLKKHKKTIVVLIVGYLIYAYLFGDKNEE